MNRRFMLSSCRTMTWRTEFSAHMRFMTRFLFSDRVCSRSLVLTPKISPCAQSFIIIIRECRFWMVALVSLLTSHLGLLTPCVSYISPTPFYISHFGCRGFLSTCIQLPPWSGTPRCFGGWWKMGLWSVTCSTETKLHRLLLWQAFFQTYPPLITGKQALIMNRLLKRKSSPTLKTAKFGATTLVSHLSDLKFPRRSSIEPISSLSDLRVSISMIQKTSSLCIHLRPLWKSMVSENFLGFYVMLIVIIPSP